MTLRAMDDVKESVRGAAGGLCRTVRALTLRLVDTQQTPAAGETVWGVCRTMVLWFYE